MNYGGGAERTPEETPEIGDTYAVALVVALFAGGAFAGLLVLAWFARAAR